MDWHARSPQEALERWGTDPQRGLSQEEAGKRQLQCSPNRLREEKGPSPSASSFRSSLILSSWFSLVSP